MSRYETYLRKIAGEDIDISNMPEPSDRIEGYLKTIAENGTGVDPEEIAEIVTDWLDDHVDPETGYVIDNTLLVEGAAADAKKVGDEIADLKSAITQLDGAVEELEQGSLSALGATAGQVPTAKGDGTWEWNGGAETVSGSTPTIVAVAGMRYECGEVSTIDFTPSATGVCDVVFTSGSTPAVLTVPNTVKFPSWFDPDNLDANTTYEINVLNGVYGAVMAWA